jgi:hypothetical protein
MQNLDHSAIISLSHGSLPDHGFDFNCASVDHRDYASRSTMKFSSFVVGPGMFSADAMRREAAHWGCKIHRSEISSTEEMFQFLRRR